MAFTKLGIPQTPLTLWLVESTLFALASGDDTYCTAHKAHRLTTSWTKENVLLSTCNFNKCYIEGHVHEDANLLNTMPAWRRWITAGIGGNPWNSYVHSHYHLGFAPATAPDI